jgi:RNA polymerase sigma factor (sigma-70 family)
MDAILTPGSPTMSDDTLLPLVYIGGTFEDLYRREYPNLIAVARALTGDRHDGEDLVQDTMVKAFVQWDRLQRYQKPVCWCLRVLTHACRDHWRRRRTRARFLDRQRHAEPWMEGPGVEFVAFWQAVRRLPQRPRLVVTLYYAGDRSIAEVAAVVKVPEGTVKSDLARARAVLVSELER